MSKKNEITKVPFYGNEIVVIEKKGRQYVAMKPIVKALGLARHKQYELIQRDLVLSAKGIPVTGIPSKGGPQEMFCLPLEYLNGWLFKVPASRYKGKKREAIIKYQEECYRALYDYFHSGAAINPDIKLEQVDAVLSKLLAEISQKDEQILALRQTCEDRQEIIDAVTSDSVFGEISSVTGKRKFVLVRQHFRSYGEPKAKKSRSCMQIVFDFFKGGK
jgi:hypothetical protein